MIQGVGSGVSFGHWLFLQNEMVPAGLDEARLLYARELGRKRVLITNPVLLVITVLVIGSIFVNGATDASNAIATAIGTRSLKPSVAVAIGAACNFIGLVVMTYISTAVANTIGKMVDFGSNSEAALFALAAAMVSISCSMYCLTKVIAIQKYSHCFQAVQLRSQGQCKHV